MLLALLLAASPVQLAELIEEAKRNNPGLAQAHALAAAAAAEVEATGTFDDPMLMVQLWNAPVDFSSVPVMFQLTQPISLGGKRGAAREVAAQSAAELRAMATAKARDVEAALGAAYFDLFLADRTLEIDAEMAATLESLLSAATARIASGKGDQAEALRAQSELLKVQSDREAVAARRTAAVARLVALLGRPAGSKLERTSEPGLLPMLPPEAELRERALRDRPEVAAAAAAIARAEAELRIERLEPVPDLALFLGGMHSFRTTGVSDFLFAGAQVNLPVFSGLRRSPKGEAAGARVGAMREAARAVEKGIEAELATAYAELVAEQREVELHHRLIPVARQALVAATASYVAGRGEFLMVLESERDVLMHELDLASHLAMYQRRLVELERAVAGDVGLRAAAGSGTRARHQEPR